MSQPIPDPMDFLKNLWGNNSFPLPGMVTPTLDTDELDKRISELKTVEGWLRTNLSMLQITIQNLEMQRSAIAVAKNMSQMYADQENATRPKNDPDQDSTAESTPPLTWPWTLMAQMQAQNTGDSSRTTPATDTTGANTTEKTTKTAAPRKRRKPE